MQRLSESTVFVKPSQMVKHDKSYISRTTVSCTVGKILSETVVYRSINTVYGEN